MVDGAWLQLVDRLSKARREPEMRLCKLFYHK